MKVLPSLRWLLLCLVVFTASCTDATGLDPDPVAEITITVDTLVLSSSQQDSLVAVAVDRNGAAVPGRTVSWNSMDTSVAQISPTGVVIGRIPGTTEVTASSEQHSATAVVVVTPIQQRPSFTLGSVHTCGITADDTTYCWGMNAFGQLGTAAPDTCRVSFGGQTYNYPCSRSPVPVGGDHRFIAIDAGGNTTCALDRNGEVYCWGYRLGSQTSERGSTPVRISSGTQFRTLAVAEEHACALGNEGAAFCWGNNRYGQLGDGTTQGSPAPVRVQSEVRFFSVVAGGSRSCGLTPVGTVYCWGGENSVPTQVAGDQRFVLLSAGDYHICGLTATGQAFCWGFNNFGQLGTGQTGMRIDAPTPVVGGHRFVSIDAGTDYTCGSVPDGAVYCWGNLGGPVPTRVWDAPLVEIMRSGWLHTCGLSREGSAYCRGMNLYGQTGTNLTVSDVRVPTAVAGQLRFRKALVLQPPRL